MIGDDAAEARLKTVLARLDEKESRFSVAAVLGQIALVAGFALSGPLAAFCFAIGGTLVGYAAYTVFCPDKGDGCPPQTCWPERDDTDTPAPEQAVTLQTHAPTSVRRWLDRVEHAAEAQAAKRGR